MRLKADEGETAMWRLPISSVFTLCNVGVPTDRQKPPALFSVEVIALPVTISTCTVFRFVFAVFCFVDSSCAVFSFNVRICMVQICVQYSVSTIRSVWFRSVCSILFAVFFLFRRSVQLFACE